MASKDNKLKARLPRGLADRTAAEIRATERMVATIRQVYERYELVARAAGSDLAFDLTDFKSVLPREYPDVRWLDLFTRGDGEVVAPSGHETVNEVTGESRLHYEFAWRPGVEREVVTLDQERFGSYSISDALLVLKLMDRGRAFPFRIETYLVTIYLDGESRTYRAAAFFYAVRDQLTVRFEDQVALRLQELALEERRVESKSRVSRWRQEWLEGARAGRITSRFGTQQCEARQFPKTSGSLATVDGTQDHESGKHYAWVNAEVTCTHGSDCTNHCTSSAPSNGCNETGTVGHSWLCTAHRLSSDHRTGFDSEYDKEVTCGTAIGCAVTTCCVGACGSGAATASPRRSPGRSPAQAMAGSHSTATKTESSTTAGNSSATSPTSRPQRSPMGTSRSKSSTKTATASSVRPTPCTWTCFSGSMAIRTGRAVLLS